MAENPNINTSAINFNELIPDNVDTTSNSSKKETKTQKKKRREPVIEARSDNLALYDNSIDSKLSEFISKFDANGELPAASQTTNDKAEIEIAEPINIDVETYEVPKETFKKTRAKATKSDSDYERMRNKNDSDYERNKNDNETKQEQKVDHTTPDDDAEFNKKIIIIHRYQNSEFFGTYLKSQGVHYTTEQLNKKSMSELDKIISQLRVMCNNKQDTNVLDTFLYGATNGIENLVTNKTDYNMKGYTEMLKHDQGFRESWELIKIERLSFARMSPELRFAWGLFSNAAAVIALNKAQEMRQSQSISVSAPPTIETPPTQQQATTAPSSEETVNAETEKREKLVYNF